MSTPTTHHELKKIWAQVPVDYYDKASFLQNLWHERKFRIVAHYLRTCRFENVLEVGCANGHLTFQIARWFPKARIHAIDVYKPMIVAAKKRSDNKRITFRVADAHNLPYQPATFDLVVCCETIEHVVDPYQVLLEMRRVLKPHGRLLVEMDSGSLLFRIVWAMYTRFFRGKVWQHAHLHPFTAQQLRRKIEESGFRILSTKHSHLGMAVTYLAKK